MKKFYLLFVFLFAFTINCSEKKNLSSEKSKSCKEVIELVEDCMELHRGSLSYIRTCGEVEINDVRNLKTCGQVIEYIIGK